MMAEEGAEADHGSRGEAVSRVGFRAVRARLTIPTSLPVAKIVVRSRDLGLLTRSLRKDPVHSRILPNDPVRAN
jgi:hypothetical protein